MCLFSFPFFADIRKVDDFSEGKDNKEVDKEEVELEESNKATTKSADPEEKFQKKKMRVKSKTPVLKAKASFIKKSCQKHLKHCL